jgi:hypothetical protein
MKSTFLLRVTAILIAAALAVPAFAKPVSRKVNFDKSVTIGKATVTAGEYRLLIDDSKVTVFRGREKVAELDGRWEDREIKHSYNSYLINRNGQLEEVRFAGDSRVLVLINR